MKSIFTNKKAVYFLSTLLLFIYILAIAPMNMQNDTFWGIKVGEKILKEGFIKIDNFSIHNGLEYIAQHYIIDIIIYVVYNAFGFLGLYIFEITTTIVITILMYLLNKQITKSKLLSYLFLFIQLFLLSGFISVRAQMLSFIIFIIELILLEKYMEDRKRIYLIGLAILPIILANFHMGTVPFYFILLGVYILNCFKLKIFCFETKDYIDKQRLNELCIIFIIGLITIFINPYHVKGVLYPLKTFSNSFINNNIQEFQPMSLSYNNMLYVFIYVFLLIITLIIYKDKINIKDVCLIFGTIFMSLVAIRYISLMVISTAVILKYIKQICVDIKRRLSKTDVKVSKVMIYIICFVLFMGSSFQVIIKLSSLTFVSEEEYPVRATNYLKGNLKSTDKIFNVYEWGSYLMLNEIPIFIDSRCDLYTKEYNKGITVAEDYIKIKEANKDYLQIIDKYNLNVLLVRTNSILYTLLSADNNFNKMYEDPTATIFNKV